MIQTLSRRKLLGGLGLLIAAPAIVKASSLMPVKAYAGDGIELQSIAHPPDVDYFMDTRGGLWTYDLPTGLWSKLGYEPPELEYSVRLFHDTYPSAKETDAMLGGSALYAIEPLRAGQPVVLR